MLAFLRESRRHWLQKTWPHSVETMTRPFCTIWEQGKQQPSSVPVPGPQLPRSPAGASPVVPGDSLQDQGFPAAAAPGPGHLNRQAQRGHGCWAGTWGTVLQGSGHAHRGALLPGQDGGAGQREGCRPRSQRALPSHGGGASHPPPGRAWGRRGRPPLTRGSSLICPPHRAGGPPPGLLTSEYPSMQMGQLIVPEGLEHMSLSVRSTRTLPSAPGPLQEPPPSLPWPGFSGTRGKAGYPQGSAGPGAQGGHQAAQTPESPCPPHPQPLSLAPPACRSLVPLVTATTAEPSSAPAPPAPAAEERLGPPSRGPGSQCWLKARCPSLPAPPPGEWWGDFLEREPAPSEDGGSRVVGTEAPESRRGLFPGVSGSVCSHIHVSVPGQLLVIAAHHTAVGVVLTRPPGSPPWPPSF